MVQLTKPTLTTLLPKPSAQLQSLLEKAVDKLDGKLCSFKKKQAAPY